MTGAAIASGLFPSELKGNAMTRPIALLLSFLAWATTAQAHFVFVVPDRGNETLYAVLSENLFPDDEVDVGMIASLSLVYRDASGRVRPIALRREEKALAAALPPGRGVVHGMVDLGVTTRGETPHVLRYYPKSVMGPADKAARVTDAPVELVPSRQGNGWRLRLLVKGKPTANTDVTVLFPGRDEKTVKTDAQGFTEILPSRGMYGAWARYWEDKPGAREGAKYLQVRHYATLVFDSTAVDAPASTSTRQPGTMRVTDLPEATSSFGAAAVGDWLYVYGGHIAPTHEYHRDGVSGKFARLNLKDGGTWESLPAGPPAQGLNLLAHRGRIYRVGGMQPRNAPGAKDEIHSLADVARFDPAKGTWEELPELPQARSSHDVVAVGSKIFVVGGWQLAGTGPIEWPDGMAVIDLSAARPEWTSIPQPFRRRALIAVAHDRRIYAIGGFDHKSQVVRAVSVYDVDTGNWSEAPTLPGEGTMGFAPAAAVMKGRLYVSLGDGGLYRLEPTAQAWVKVGQATPRIAHRLIPVDGRILVVGGADKGANSNLIEEVIPAP